MPAPDQALLIDRPPTPEADEVASRCSDTPAPAVAAQISPSEVDRGHGCRNPSLLEPACRTSLPNSLLTLSLPKPPSKQTRACRPSQTYRAQARRSPSPPIAEAELKLAELAALLPVTAEPGGATPAAPVEPLPENGLHTHAPDLVPRGFVPPAPMSTRGTPAVVEVPIRTGGRGWMAATLAMALVAVALAGLISAWRFFPERLPAQLRANTLLNLTTTAQPAAPKAQPGRGRRGRTQRPSAARSFRRIGPACRT